VNKLLATLAFTAAATIGAQQPRTYTAADYARAEQFLGYKANPLVTSGPVRPTWLADGRFWYRNATAAGAEVILVDPVKKTRDLCAAPGATCAAASSSAAQGGRGGRGGRGAVPVVNSPDGKLAAFRKDNNLWVRDIATGAERAITSDGVKDFGYATDNAGWTTSARAVLLWSPDSKKIATFQQDERGVGEMYLVSTKVGHPALSAWKYPLPGDSIITTIQRVVIDVAAARVVRFQMPADQHRSTLCDDISCRGDDFTDTQWSPDGSKVAFVSNSRDHKVAQLRIADAATGAIRDVLEERAATQYESGNGAANWHVLWSTNEVVWFSERSDWGQLYLYDLNTGKLKNAITTGDGSVAAIVTIDEKSRTVWFTATGREKGRDPYFRHLYKATLDGKKTTLLTPDDGDHDVALAPSGKYFIDNYSKPDVPVTAVLRDVNDGKLIVSLEKQDISRLAAALDWKPPMPITVKARDGKTDLYGLLYRPVNFDATKKYPIINHIYPGPQTGSVAGRTFNVARGDAQALAELGFVVVEIDGMGTPWRSKSFHDAYYGDMGDNTLPDQVVAMKELAQRYSWIDIDRAGIYGHSGGGYATADAMFRYPDFFKVGISEAGNHDNRGYEDDWAERYVGLLKKNADGTSNYDSQANQTLAKNLKGKLLLAHGTMDNNVPPYNTLLVVNELIKANKDFDLLLLPNRNHGFGNEPYMIRRRWDYFVKNLLGGVPPKEFELKPPTAGAVPPFPRP
jgi:dipeptidyl-peptidase-4